MLPASTRGIRHLRRLRKRTFQQQSSSANVRNSQRRLQFEQFEPRQLLAADLSSAIVESQDWASTQQPALLQDATHQELGQQEDWRSKFDLYAPPKKTLIQYGGFLTDTAPGEPLQIADGFLVSRVNEFGLSPSDLQDYIVTDQYSSAHTDVTHIYLQQRHQGLPVVGANVNINIMDDGRVLNVGSSFVPLATQSRGSIVDGSQEVSTTTAFPSLDGFGPLWSGAEVAALTAEEALFRLADQFDWELDEPPQMVAAELGPANRGQRQLLTASGVSLDEIPAELQYVPQPEGLELAWRLIVRRPDGRHWFDAHVSAGTGEVLSLADWSNHAAYDVFAVPKESPSDGPRTLEIDPQDTTASPFGWHDTNGVVGAEFTTTQGNNVWAYTDRDGDDLPDLESSPDGGAGLSFDFPLDLAQAPLSYRDASVANVFYLSNVLHDVHYQYGFTEQAGNFQQNNYGKGGVGGDPVLAEAQDQADGGPFGAQRNNANFLAPPDGLPGRLQLFLFDQTTPERDSSLDFGIVAHEYAHGVSTRLTGGPANAGSLGLDFAQSAGMGEGWSDWYSLMFTQLGSDSAGDARGVGTYVLGQPSSGLGIRTQPYSYDMSVNTLTLGDIGEATSIYPIGEVWASVLWDLNWALIQGSALDANLPNAGLGFDPNLYTGTGGNNLAMQLVMDGMKLQPTTPTFLEGRDAILAADMALTGGANQITIWTVFARRGMGYSADDGGTSIVANVTEAFDLPSTPNGVVVFDETTINEGGLLSITLSDSDLTGIQTLQVSSLSGDTENIELNPEGVLGVFVGTLDTGAGAAMAGDGVLQVSAGDVVTVSYLDASDGLGGSDIPKSAAAIIQTRLAPDLQPLAPGGGLLSTSEAQAVLRSAADVEPFTFFAEAGELISVTALPGGENLLEVQIAGLSATFPSMAAGAPATVPPTLIPTTGNYQVLVGTDSVATADVNLIRNAVSEKQVGDSADGNELLINASGVAVGGGTRYAVSAQAVPIGPGIVNGSFETGDYSGWDRIAIGNAFVPWTVSGPGAGAGFGLASTEPQAGDFVAWNGFEGAGPMEYLMTQDVLLPDVPVSLAWKDRIQWDFTVVGTLATEGKTFEVQVRDPNDGTILARLHSFDTQPEFIVASGDTGWQSHSVDLSAFRGQYVQLAFVENIPQSFEGPGQVEIDDVELVGMPAPAPDIDEFLLDLRGKAGQQMDIVLASDKGLLASSTVELLDRDGSTVLATGSVDPLAMNSDVRNYRSGILGFSIPADGVYTLRVTASEYGDYQLLVTESVVFDTERNDDMPLSLLRSLDAAGGALGYVDGVSAYEVVEIPFDFEDLSTDASFVFLGDDQVSTARNIGFDFDFYDQTHSSLYVSSNGFLTLLATDLDGCCFGKPLPDPSNPDAVIAGWWRDLNPGANVNPIPFIRHKTIGTVGDRVFALEFNGVPHVSDRTLGVTMQFKLFEATGDIEVHYVKAPADGRDHSAGIEDHTGARGTQYYFGLDSLPDNLAVRYQRVSPVDRYTLTLQAGEEVSLRTRTPFDAGGHAAPNTLDPEIRVIHPDGVTVVGSDLNSLDGKNASLTFTAPVSGVYTVEVKASAGVGEYALEKIQADQAGPRITNVIVGSSAWSDAFINVVDGGGPLAGNGLGVSLIGPEQLDNLPWINIDKIYVQFNEDVSPDFTVGKVLLSGVNVSDYMSGATTEFGIDGENVATITLATPIAKDVVLLRVLDSLRDNESNALDGEWTDAESLLSGNGAGGGSFSFRLDALPGDVDNTGGVNLVDVFDVYDGNGDLTTSAALSLLDVDGNGGINLVDLFAVYNRNGTILPNPPAGDGDLPLGDGLSAGSKGDGSAGGAVPVAGFPSDNSRAGRTVDMSTSVSKVPPSEDRARGLDNSMQRATDNILADFDYTRDSGDPDDELHGSLLVSTERKNEPASSLTRVIVKPKDLRHR